MTIDPASQQTTVVLEQALSQTGEEHFVLRLYLTGQTNRSLQAVQAVTNLCEQHLHGRYDLQVVDLYEQPELAQAAQIIAAPTLVKELPLPLRRLIGDLTDTARVLVALNLKREEK